MILQIANVLSGAELTALRDLLSREEVFKDGRQTAGWRARERKANLQATPESPLVIGASRKVAAALERNEIFQAAARPKKVLKLLFSRYEAGMAYGWHVDDAMMAGQRTDLSFTLFLSEPDSYEGGELVIERSEGERSFKLSAGQLVLYPSTTLHRVAPVADGVRLAAVGWIRSLIRDEAARELLFDLDQAAHLLRHSSELERVIDLILKARSNLMRRWVDD